MTVSESPVEGFAVIPNWIIRDQSIPRNIIAVYVVLTSHADRHGSCFPSLDLIAAESGLSKSTVQRTLNEMKERGLTDWQHVKTPNGWRNTYVLSVYQGGGVWSPRPEGCGHSETPPVVTMTTEEYPVEEHLFSDEVGGEIEEPSELIGAEEDMAFDEFWSLYPKKEAKKKAKIEWDRALKRGAKPVDIIDAEQRHPALKRERQWVPQPDKWLRNEQFNDELEPASVTEPWNDENFWPPWNDEKVAIVTKECDRLLALPENPERYLSEHDDELPEGERVERVKSSNYRYLGSKRIPDVARELYLDWQPPPMRFSDPWAGLS